jgi:hypothetical protein
MCAEFCTQEYNCTVYKGFSCYCIWQYLLLFMVQTVEVGRLKRMHITLCLLCGAD